MKSYGAFKATEFTKKQINVIYSKAKSGEIKMERWVASRFYDLADYYGYDDNGSVADSEQEIFRILDAVFAGDIERTQTLIDRYTENHFGLMSKKNQAKANRSIIA